MYKINHIGVVVSDMERSINFYQDVLDMKLKSTFDDEELGLAFFDCSGQTVELVKYKSCPNENRDGAKGRVDHIAFFVSDIEKEIVRLKEKNVKLIFDTPKNTGESKIFFFEGPDGERLEFVQVL